MRLLGAATAPERLEPEASAPGVLLAPDSFGGWRTAPQIADLMGDLFAREGIRATRHPMADGGEGTVEALLAHSPGVLEPVEVPGPHRRRRAAGFARVAGLTLVESAAVLGPERGRPHSPMSATSFGLGVLLCAAARKRRGALVLGLGGTCTMDGGLGLLQALGLRALDAAGHTLPPGGGAAALRRLHKLDGKPEGLGMVEVWCDVRTPLRAAPATFGPQKGANDDQIADLTAGFDRLARALAAWRRSVGRQPLPPDLPGGGAAGGLGFAMAALDARLRPGAEAFAAHTGLHTALASSRTVLTGEGRLDPTSFEGKVVDVVVRQARGLGLAVGVVCGQAAPGPPPPRGPDAVFVAEGDDDREVALARACRRAAGWARDPAPERPPLSEVSPLTES